MTLHEQSVALRRATPDDAETIVVLTNAAYAKYVPLIGRKPQPMTADYRQMIAEHHVWLLTKDGQPAGVLVLMYQLEHMLIYSVAVAPQYQKQGWGRHLLKWAEAQAQQAGYSLIRLYTNERMEANIALYQRLGYEETEREDYLGSTLVHMTKHLTI
jgi:ribosomal protein S18 acetylase RimI-like enzyme